MNIAETYAIGKAIARNHRCGECDGRMSIAWGGAFGIKDWVIRCVRHHDHKTLTRIPDHERRVAGG